MDFWNDVITRKSWEVLKMLNSRIRFIVIGGWGIYLWTHALKSRDVDILLLNWEELEKIKKDFLARKNDRLKKYEVIIDDVDVDIYLPHYSKLVIPCEDLIKMTSLREGFNVLNPEPLLILKQQACTDRVDSLKGLKDRVDIISLLVHEIVDFGEYNNLTEKYGLQKFREDLRRIIQNAQEEFRYLNITNPREIRQLKRKWLESL